MENKKIPSSKKLISIQEEKLIRQVDYDSIAESSNRSPKKLLLGNFFTLLEYILAITSKCSYFLSLDYKILHVL